MKHRYIPQYHDPILINLHRHWKMDDQNMAERMAFSVSTIQLNRTRLGLPCNVRPFKQQYAVYEQDRPAPKEKVNPIGAAMVWLGKRLVEKPAGYFLDGVPVSLDAIMRETNRVIKEQGAEQIGYCDRWVV